MPFESRISQGTKTITIGWTDRDGSSFGSCMAYALLGGPRSVPVFVCGSFFVHHTLREVGEIPTYKLMWDEHFRTNSSTAARLFSAECTHEVSVST